MSLKSFDKFCEKLIKGEPVDSKEVFDERQTYQRTKSAAKYLLICLSLSALNTMLMESDLRWSESCFLPMMMFFMLCYLAFVIENYLHGSLFGVKGTKNGIVTAGCFIGLGAISLLNFSGKEFTVLKDGMLSERFLGMIIYALYVVCGIVTLILAHRFNKANEKENTQQF